MEYKYVWGLPDNEMLDSIRTLHQPIFHNADEFITKMSERPRLLAIIALENQQAVGYKVGYALSEETYYSWYGGVDEAHRGKGIAANLMDLQHELVREAGFQKIQTNTRNKWREMLVLNIKKGFDVDKTFIDADGIHRIVLAKEL